MTAATSHAASSRGFVVQAVVDATEPLRFARDLGGSLTHVLVAATGRALAGFDRATPAGALRRVGLAVTSREGGLWVAGIPGAADAPLPAVRDLVDAALADPEAVELVVAESPTVVVVDRGTGDIVVETLLGSAAAVLEAGPCEGDPGRMPLTLRTDDALVAGETSEDLVARIARLVERPYRRLV
jgi:hypothetical protein